MTFEFRNKKTMTVTEKDSIENNIGMIAGTPYATAPFFRDMGIKEYPPNANSEITRNRYASEIISQTDMWEDRVKVSEVHFTSEREVRMVIENV